MRASVEQGQANIDRHGESQLSSEEGSSNVSGQVVGSILSLGSGQIAARVLGFVATVYLARVLGPDHFGIIGFAIAISGYISLAVNGGVNAVGPREVARRPQEATSMAASVMLFRLFLACGALALTGLVAWLLPKPSMVKLVVFLTGLSYFSLALDTAWVHKGLEQNGRVGIAFIITKGVYVGLVLLLVQGPDDVFWAPLALVAGELVAAAFLGISLFYRAEFSVELRKGLDLFRQSLPLAGSKVLRTLIISFDVILLGLMLSERAVGLYTAPYQICFVVLSISVMVHVSYLPSVSRAVEQGKQRVREISNRSLEMYGAFFAPIVVGGIIIAGPLLLAVFGSDYMGGTRAFQVLLVAVGVGALRGTIHNLFLAYDRLATEMWLTAGGAGLNVLLNLFLIPRYGLVGAAFTTVLSEGVILVGGMAVIHRMELRLKYRSVLPALLAAALMGGGVLAVKLTGLATLGPIGNLALYLGVGAVLYAFALTAFRGIPRDVASYWGNTSLLKERTA